MAVGSAENAKAFRGEHELEQGMGLELLHDALAMRLHGAFGDVELMRDLLVQPAMHDQSKDLALPRRQLLEQLTQRSILVAARLPLLMACDRPLDRLEELVSGHRFDQKILRPRLDR